VPRVKGRLAAADLASRELDLDAGRAQEGLRVRDSLGEDEVAEARREKLDAVAAHEAQPRDGD
jgi:hypothetical protein